ncbi:MAG: hypothetical protein ACO37I_06425 [Burkholderiaceae bacterium]|jgi:hypothetical protein
MSPELEAMNLLRKCAERRRSANIPAQKAALALNWSVSKLEKIEADALKGEGSFHQFSAEAKAYDAWLTQELGGPFFVPHFLRHSPPNRR